MQDGVTGHHRKPIAMKMRMENGELANRDKENIAVFSKHLTKAYNHQRLVHADAANLIARREVMESMDENIGWEEFNKAITKLKNEKSPGENGVPPNVFKCLDANNRRKVYDFVVRFWKGEEDFEEWHVGLVKLLPKSGDLRNPNKLRGITLIWMYARRY